VGVALGQVGDEVAQGDEVGAEKKVVAVDGMGTIYLEGGER
jgi:hypothetical protein